MPTKLPFGIMLLCFTHCSPSQLVSTDEGCNKEKATEIAEKRFKRKGYDKEYYNLAVEEDSLFYVVKYELDLAKAQIGGGAEVTISKQNCSIVDQKFYQ